MSTPPATARLRVVQNIAKRPATATFDEELLLGVDVSFEITQAAYINGGDIEIPAKKKSWVTSDETTGLWQITLPVTADTDPQAPYSVREGKDGPIQYFNVLPGSGPMDLYDGLTERPSPISAGVTLATVEQLIADQAEEDLGTYVSIEPRVTTLALVASTYTPDVDTTDVGLIAVPTGNFTVGNPSGSPGDEQRLLIKVRSGTTGYAPTWGNGFVSSGVATLPAGALPANKTVTFGFMYDATATKWVLLASDPTGY